MSRYPEVSLLWYPARPQNSSRSVQADEGQRRHYNDGYNTHDTDSSPYDRPYDPQQPYGSVLPDPFVTPQQQQHLGPFADPPGAHDAYGQPMPPHSGTPPMPVTDYMHPHFNPDMGAPGSYPASTTVVGGSTYDLHDDNGEDPGDMPLLRRGGSAGSNYSMPHVPGGYNEPVISDNRSENNIRYGHIPQRVPRRYKTIKKVE